MDQNVDQPIPGEVLAYDRFSGAFLGAIVSSAGWAPRGMILDKHHTLYVADQGETPDHPGRIAQFDVRTGAFGGYLDPSGIMDGWGVRGLVVGPDKYLYATVYNRSDPLDGQVLRFDLKTGTFLGVVVDGTDDAGAGDPCGSSLNRTEGLTFGPDGRLYVTSFRANAADTDKILIYEVSDGVGVCVDKIVLDEVAEPRSFAQALVFGPEGYLFVSMLTIISTMPLQFAGEVRRYDVQTKTYDVFVPSTAEGGQLGIPLYMTFGETDPATLAYEGKGKGCNEP